jgi:hypothetical protein
VPGLRLLGILAIMAVCACSEPVAAPRELPEATKPLAICLYNTLKTMPGIVAVDAFVQDVPRMRKTFAVIGYWVRDKSGKPGMSTLSLSGPPDAERLHFSLSEAAPGDTYFAMSDQLEAKCHAGAYYDDQVLINPPRLPPMQKVDMARYIK